MKKKRGVVTTRCKMRCPLCQTVEKVLEVGDLLTLACGHQRIPETLPLGAPNFISFEHMRSAISQKLFPPRNRFEENIDREAWT
jgi:hypothetical protein